MSSIKFLKNPAILLLSVFLFLMTFPFPAHKGNAQSSIWTMQKDTKIVWASTTSSPKADKYLEEHVYLFSSQLSTKLNIDSLSLVYEPSAQAGEHDIILYLDENLGIAPQCYQFKVGSGRVTISASDSAGLFNGCNQFIKDLLANGSVGEKSDSPVVQKRAVFLDIARNYYSVDSIKSLIREMSWNSYNQLYVHFLDDSGLGIESQYYYWLNGRDSSFSHIEQSAKNSNSDSRQLTQNEIKDIGSYARKYNVSLVPSIEIPAHANYLINKLNEKSKHGDWSFKLDGTDISVTRNTDIANSFQYAGQTKLCTSYNGTTNGNSASVVDITNPIACSFIKSLISDYAQLFIECGSTEINLGGSDPFSDVKIYIDPLLSPWQQLDHWKGLAQQVTGSADAVAYDAYALCLNDFSKHCGKLGYKTHLWNTGVWTQEGIGSIGQAYSLIIDPKWKAVASVDTSISILYNRHIFDPDYFLKAGYQIYNFDNYFSSYVAGYNADMGNKARVYPGQVPSTILNSWTTFTFVCPGVGTNPAAGNPGILGCGFIIWGNDDPEFIKDTEIVNDVVPCLQARSMKFWNNSFTQIAKYSQYEAYFSKIGNAPSINDFIKQKIKNETTQSGPNDFNVQPILLFSAVALIVVLFCIYKFITRKKTEEVFYNYPRQ
ncbi:MAG: family 20 glycosylhydrolase [Eggerthellaceae bacterium]|nr:family 20 glycosylhydrolase [Eggerthellaceae bacterium]